MFLELSDAHATADPAGTSPEENLDDHLNFAPYCKVSIVLGKKLNVV